MFDSKCSDCNWVACANPAWGTDGIIKWHKKDGCLKACVCFLVWNPPASRAPLLCREWYWDEYVLDAVGHICLMHGWWSYFQILIACLPVKNCLRHFWVLELIYTHYSFSRQTEKLSEWKQKQNLLRRSLDPNSFPTPCKMDADSSLKDENRIVSDKLDSYTKRANFTHWCNQMIP